jgi:two-component system sensor histidine kinase ChvG
MTDSVDPCYSAEGQHRAREVGMAKRMVHVALVPISILLAVSAVLYLLQFHQNLIEARVASLRVQGKIIARAIASPVTLEPDVISLDLDRLEAPPPDQGGGSCDKALLDVPIDAARISALLRRLVLPATLRARLYDCDGVLLVDGDKASGVDPARRDAAAEPSGRSGRIWIGLKNWVERRSLPLYRDLGAANGGGNQEVAQALAGQTRSMVRVGGRGEPIVSVAVPVQGVHQVRAALLLEAYGIDQIIAAELLVLLKACTIALTVGMALWVLLVRITAAARRGGLQPPDR